jgi:hypothetical protein
VSDGGGFTALTPVRAPAPEVHAAARADVSPRPWQATAQYGISPFVNNYTRPLPSYAETFSGPGYFTPPPKSSVWATLALVFALLGVVLSVPALLAIVFGHIGVVQTRNNLMRGRGLAMAALVLGYVVVGFWALLLTAIWLSG